jgi:hypothetical protein
VSRQQFERAFNIPDDAKIRKLTAAELPPWRGMRVSIGENAGRGEAHSRNTRIARRHVHRDGPRLKSFRAAGRNHLAHTEYFTIARRNRSLRRGQIASEGAGECIAGKNTRASMFLCTSVVPA